MRIRIVVQIVAFLGLAVSSAAQGEKTDTAIAPTVIVTLGKPNIWTMEQAHYLLEKNRAHDLGIAAADLGPLDANEIVGYRLEAVRSLLSAQAQYDAVTGKKNSASLQQYNIDMARYNLLRNQLDSLRSRQASVTSELDSAQYQLSVLQAQTPKDDKAIALQNAKIANLQGEQGALNSEANSLSQSLGNEPTLTSLTSTVPSGDETSQSVIGSNSTFATMMSGIPQGLNNSKTQASIKLDNFVNLQYEIVAKQLTLLRDEAGPGKRVIFVELPQSIYATHKFKPYPDIPAFWGSHLVQTWWRIRGLVTASKLPGTGQAATGTACQPAPRPTLRQILESSSNEVPSTGNQPQMKIQDANRVYELLNIKPPTKNDNSKPEGQDQNGETSPGCTQVQWALQAFARPENDTGNGDSQAYSLDLIPRQSALNVADAHSSSRAYGFAGLFGLLTGFGAKARYEQQRDKYDQFVQQEAYASAFGKGEDTFGWTFGPLPGTKRLAPGLRTTYAVLVVPRDTRIVSLEGIGCGYRRRRVPRDPFKFKDGADAGEDCGSKVTYNLEIPDNVDSFFVNRIYYKPVPAGQRMMVELQGTFSTQVGVLINGTPLQKVVSLGQPLLEQTNFNIPGNAGESGVQGVFELVGNQTILMSFVTPATFNGTPRIAIVTPGHASVINQYSIEVHDGSGTSTLRRLDDALSMLYQTVGINRSAAIYDRSTSATQGALGKPSVLLEFFGQGFQPQGAHRLLISGYSLTEQPSSTTSLNLNEFRVADGGFIQARVERSECFPHYQADFFVIGGNQTAGVTNSIDDDGPPEFDSCRQSITTDGKTKTISVVIKGKYFSVGYAPTSSNSKALALSSTTFNSSEQWTLVGTLQGSLAEAGVTLKGASSSSSSQFTMDKCTADK